MLAFIALVLVAPAALLALTLVPAVGVNLILSRYWNTAQSDADLRDEAPRSFVPSAAFELHSVAA